jgi:PKD repeat protein
MFKHICLFVILLLFTINASPQLSLAGKPESFSFKTKKAQNIPFKVLSAIDTTKLLADDKKTGIPNRYGIVQQLDIDIKSEGAKSEIEGKGYIWQYRVKSTQALALGITFAKYLLPKGARVFIIDESHTHFSGAFTSQNNNSMNSLTIADFKGNNAIIEYFEPYNPEFSGQLTISSIVQAYKNTYENALKNTGINCIEGAEWQELKHSVCFMTFHDSEFGYYCTGFLVNNVKEDGTPYFQTANHCISTNSMASTLVTYFNYENSNCTDSDSSLDQSLSGAKLISTYAYSDFTLLLLNEYPPNTYQPYYAGWDASNAVPQKGTCIHHPAGNPKSIALDYNALKSNSNYVDWYDDNGNVIGTSQPNSHWEVNFDIGATTGGSSGSPIFDENNRVIGQLHGGGDGEDFYGKFSLSWDHSLSAPTQLKAWLDPDNRGITRLDGLNGTTKPKALFSTNLTQICPGTPIKFSDSSKYNPTNWSWDVYPSTFKFVNGTTINSQNPEIIFDSIGIYSVKLTVSNSKGSDSITKTNYIHAGELKVNISGITDDSVICGCNLIYYPVSFSGASSYQFSIERPDKINYTSSADKLYLSLLPAEKKNGPFSSWLKIVGTQGSCTSADSAELNISMPVNDDIENAIRLWPGRNKPYSNFCASVETSEIAPFPAPLKNTIWFTFHGPSNSLINIGSKGLNGRLAVYKANNYTDLLSGTRSSFVLASIDKRSASDSNLAITNLKVDPYQNYWLQVDGSDGSTGNIVIDLLSNSLEVFPNPSNGVFDIIISNNNDGNAEVKVVSLLGQVVYSNNFQVTKENNLFSFNLSAYPSGIYIVYIGINGNAQNKKLLLVK